MPTLTSALKSKPSKAQSSEDADDLHFLGAAKVAARAPTIPGPQAVAPMTELGEVKFVKSRPQFKAGPPLETPGPSRTNAQAYPTIPGTKATSTIKSVP